MDCMENALKKNQKTPVTCSIMVLEFHRIVLCKTFAISSPFGVECTCPVEVAGCSFAVAADLRDRVVL